MPTTADKKKFSDQGPCQILVGAGGSPSGETTAPPRSVIDGSWWGRDDGELRQELVDGAVDRVSGRRRVRQAFGVPSDRRISNEVIDQLLAGASTEEEIAGPGGLLAQLTTPMRCRPMNWGSTMRRAFSPVQSGCASGGRTGGGHT